MILKGYDKNSKQCRERWSNYINPSLKKNPLTKKEINTLFRLYHSYGTAWSKMTSILKNRSNNRLKNTFHREVKKIVKIMKRKLIKFKNLSTFYAEFTINLSVLTKVGKMMNIPLNKIPHQNIFEIIKILKSFNNKKPRAKTFDNSEQEPKIKLANEYSNDNSDLKVIRKIPINKKEINNQLSNENPNEKKEEQEFHQIQELRMLKSEEKLESGMNINFLSDDFILDEKEYGSCDFSLREKIERIQPSPTFRDIFENEY